MIERVGRIRVDRLLGEGGMGKVYLGYDELLERKVALKVLRPGHDLGDEARARFLREARVLSRLDHPGICRMVDLAETPQGLCLVLELVEGRTLRSLLAEGSLTGEERLRIGARIAAALAAAHRVKVVHRDLKPENVMVTPAGEVKVLDFGIARFLGEPATGTAAEPSGPAAGAEAAGTPDRAGAAEPAQESSRPPAEPGPVVEATVAEPRAGGLHGEDPAAALAAPPSAGPGGHPSAAPPPAPATAPTAPAASFATRKGSLLGTAHYMSPEQAAGAEVDEASDVFSLGLLLQELLSGQPAYPPLPLPALLARVKEGRTEPVRGVDTDVAALIARMLAPAPPARPAATEVAGRLEWILAKPQRRRRRRAVAAAAVLGAVLLTAAVVLAARWGGAEPLLATGEQPRVALLPFANATGEARLGWVVRGLPEMIEETLRQSAAVQVVPLATTLDAMKRFEMAPGGAPEPAAVQRLGRALGANLLVESRLEHAEGGLRLRYTLHRREGPPVVKELAARDALESGNRLARALASRLDPQARLVTLADRFSDDPFANESYGIGLERADTAGPRAAASYFAVCLDRDPGFLWAKLRLAASWHEMAQTADRDRLLQEVLAEARRRGDRSVEAAALQRLGIVASDGGDLDASDRYLQRARELIGPRGDGYQLADVVNNLANNAYFRGDLPRAERLWEETRQRAQALGYRLREAGATANLAATAFARRDLRRAGALWEEARRAAEELGNRVLAARMEANLALVAVDERRLDDAERLGRRALAVYRETGYGRGVPVVLNNLGELLAAAGRTEEAAAMYREGLELARGGDDPLILARLAGGLALLVAGDDPAAGRELLAEATAAAARVGAPEAEIELAKVRAELALRAGDVATARAAVAIAERGGADTATEMLRARLLYAEGRREEALRVAEAAHALPDAWTARDEAQLGVLRRAAAAGRQLPLPR